MSSSFGYNSLPGNCVYGSSTSPALSTSNCCSSTFGYNSLTGNCTTTCLAPAAPFDSVQYNDSGDFGGDSAFTYNQSTATLTVTNIKPTTITDDVNSVGTSGQYLSSTGTGVDWVTLPTIFAPGAPTNSIQYNDGVSFAGSSNLIFTPGTSTVNVNGKLSVGLLTAPAPRMFVLSTNAFFTGSGAWNDQWLTVGDNATVGGSGVGLGWNSTSNYGTLLCVDSGTAFRPMYYTASNHIFGTIDGTERVRILNNGNVGIGTVTPNGQLQLSNAVANRKIVLNEVANNDHQYYGMGINTSLFRFQIPSTVADYAFFVGTGVSTSTENMRLTGTGNLVVGRNATSLITISKGTGTTASSSFQGYLKVGGAEYGAANGTRRMIGFGYNTGANNQPAYIGYEERETAGQTYGDLIFGTRNLPSDVIPTDRMRILANGNVCIGINTTTFALDVVGAVQFGAVSCAGVTFPNFANVLTFSNTSTVRNGNPGFNLSSNAGTAVVMSTFAQPYPFNLPNGVSRTFYDYTTYILTISAGNSSAFAGFGRWQFNVQVPVVVGTSGAMALQSASALGGPYTTVAYTEQYNTFVLKLLYTVNVTNTTYFRLVSVGSIHTVNMNNLDCFCCVDCLG